MRRTVTLVFLVAFVASLAPMASHAKRKKQERVPPELLAIVERVSTGRANFFLRNAFDTDPSPYLGRFVPDGTSPGAIDDASAMQTSCSQHISYTKVGGGGVQYDEYFNASTIVSANLGLPLLSAAGIDIGADVGHGSGSIVRVRYTMNSKMVATIDDPDAFAECCEDGPGKCTGLFLGEFLEGSGEVLHFTSSGTNVRAGVGVRGVELGADVKDGVTWQRAISFPNPVYFAFKTTTVPADLVQTFDDCGDWTTRVPESNRGMYFVGLSEVQDSERLARDQARRDARVQVVQYLGEVIQTGSVETRSTSGSAANLSSSLDQEDIVQAASTGIAELVKDRSWCIEEHPTPGGVKYSAKVLAFLPQSEEEGAVEAMQRANEPPVQ